MVELVRDSYAGVLFDLALEANQEEAIGKQLQEIQEIMGLNPEFFVLLTSPQIPKEQRITVLDQTFGNRVEDVLLRFMKVLIHNRRMDYLLEVAKRYQELLRNHKGILYVEAITAEAMDENQKSKLVQVLESRTRKTIELYNVVQQDVLGGLKLKMGEQSLDATLKGRLKELQSLITKY